MGGACGGRVNLRLDYCFTEDGIGFSCVGSHKVPHTWLGHHLWGLGRFLVVYRWWRQILRRFVCFLCVSCLYPTVQVEV